jgi:hypothetical protein
MKEMPGPVEEGPRPSGDVYRTESLPCLKQSVSRLGLLYLMFTEQRACRVWNHTALQLLRNVKERSRAELKLLFTGKMAESDKPAAPSAHRPSLWLPSSIQKPAILNYKSVIIKLINEHGTLDQSRSSLVTILLRTGRGELIGFLSGTVQHLEHCYRSAGVFWLVLSNGWSCEP